jgi:hypothetical protein
MTAPHFQECIDFIEDVIRGEKGCPVFFYKGILLSGYIDFWNGEGTEGADVKEDFYSAISP